MKLKTIEIEGKTYAEVQDGKPLYEAEDGKAVAFDAAATVATINRITDESKGFKSRAQDAEGKLKAFDGIDDPKAAKDALAKVANWGDKELVEAGKVEEIKAAAIKAKDDEYKPFVEKVATLEAALHSEKIGGSFARSKFITDKFAASSRVAESLFGKNFKLEDGQIVAYDASGNKLYSKSSPGNPASFDEALEMLVDQDPDKDNLLRGSGGSGTGKEPGNGGGGSVRMTTADFNKLSAKDRAAVADKPGFALTD